MFCSFPPKVVSLEIRQKLCSVGVQISMDLLCFHMCKGVSERIGCVLKQQQVGVLYRPQRTINSLFPHPKEQDGSDRQNQAWYTNQLHAVQFCILRPNRKTIKDADNAEQRKAVSSFNHNSKVAGHVHNLNHNMDFENTKVVGLEANYHK